MGVPATSAAFERVFPNGGDIITKQRNKLSGNSTRYLLCLMDTMNLRLLNLKRIKLLL